MIHILSSYVLNIAYGDFNRYKLLRLSFQKIYVRTMSISEYLHENAAESRHKESVGFSLVILGMVLIVGGLLITLVTIGNPDWFLFIPWKQTSDPTSLISLFMTLGGFVVVFAGAIYIIYASSKRSGYLSSLQKASKYTREREGETFEQKMQELKEEIVDLQQRSETE